MASVTGRIKHHYNLLAPFYYGFWGQHIHHGYWADAADTTPPARAQERLIEQLYGFGGSRPVRHMLDIGCGFAGTLLWFAHHTQAQGVGLTLSPVQCLLGRLKVRSAGFRQRMAIHAADAQQRWALPAAAFDLVWSTECTEHLEDRAHFAREAYRVLEPGGVLLVAAWLAGPQQTAQAARLRREVEQGMLCHPFDTAAGYMQHFRAAGFGDMQSRAITPHVVRTWDICMDVSRQPGLSWLSRLLGDDVRAFTDSFMSLRQAYQEGAMEYGLFRAYKPTS